MPPQSYEKILAKALRLKSFFHLSLKTQRRGRKRA